MTQNRFAAVATPALAVALAIGMSAQARAQDRQTRYARLAPVGQYLIPDRNAEIAFARSAAPPSVSRDAEVLVLGPHGYETAVKGTNGFVCVVERSWMQPLDSPVFFDPDVRLPLCLNAPAARTHLALTVKTTELALAGLSTNQISDSIRAAFDRKALPLPDPGSMCFMMSKQQNFGPGIGHADPHLMFWFPRTDAMAWGAAGDDSPVDVHQYSPQPITEFAISVAHWSDGTAR